MSDAGVSDIGRCLAVITSEDDLHQALRARAEELNYTRRSISLAACLTESHAEKLLSPVPMKRMGPMSRYSLIGALDAELWLVTARRRSDKAKQRRAKVNMHGSTVQMRMSRKELRRRQKLGGKNSRKNMTKHRASQLGRRAAKKRWSTPKIEEIKPMK